MSENDRILERAKIDNMICDFSLEDQSKIKESITEVKNLLRTETLSFETIAILIFLYKKTK